MLDHACALAISLARRYCQASETGAMIMPAQPRIQTNPKVMQGKPVIRGTRITVELVLRKLGEGATPQDLLDAYPHLTIEDIQAAITFAADTVAHEDILVIESKM
jgi:uncharacterized protein (DUF433 family)